MKKKYVVIMVITLIVSVCTVTLAYFQGNVINDLINGTTVGTGNVDIKISDSNISINNLIPMYNGNVNYEDADFVKHFSIKNTGSLNECVDLYLKINNASSGLLNNYLRYLIINDETDTIINGNFGNVDSSNELKLGSLYFYEKDEVKNYTMYIWIEYDENVNQISMLNKSMSASLFVKATDSKTRDVCDNRETYKITYVYSDDICKSTTASRGSNVTLCTPSRDGEEFKGWYSDKNYTNQVTSLNNINNDVKLYGKWNCIFDGELTQGASYTHGQYTYRYKQHLVRTFNTGLVTPIFYVPDQRDYTLSNISADGWGVYQTSVYLLNSTTDAVSGPVCSYINDKPVVSASYMFGSSKASSIDISDFNTSNILSMGGMFYNTDATKIKLGEIVTDKVVDMHFILCSSDVKKVDIYKFNTSNVVNMAFMFASSKFKNFDLSNFDTSKVTTMNGMFAAVKTSTIDLSGFNTSNVTNMEQMFNASEIPMLDLSNFDMSKVTELSSMFKDAKISNVYVKDENMSILLSDSSTGKPDTMIFTIK